MVFLAALLAQNHDYQAAVASLQAATAQTTSDGMRQTASAIAEAIASKFISADQRGTAASTTGLAAAKIATDMLPHSAVAMHSYGTALSRSGRMHDALAAYDQALALDPGNVAAHGNRAIALLKPRSL